jgi:hypothetical protein
MHVILIWKLAWLGCIIENETIFCNWNDIFVLVTMLTMKVNNLYFVVKWSPKQLAHHFSIETWINKFILIVPKVEFINIVILQHHSNMRFEISMSKLSLKLFIPQSSHLCIQHIIFGPQRNICIKSSKYMCQTNIWRERGY